MDFVKRNFKYLFLLFLLVGAVFVWYAVFWESRSGLEVDFLDVGQGDAIFIQAPNGNQLLLDGGPNKSVLNQLSKVMPFYDRTIDVLMLSHPHGDHISGLLDVLKRYKILLVIEPCLEVNTAEYKGWLDLINQKQIKRICGKRGEKICLDEGLCMDLLLPVGDVVGRKEHDAMLVAKLNYGNNSFFLAGDMQKNLENYLVYLGKNAPAGGLKSDVLKIGHHGSDTSSSESFLGFVSPEYTVISVGKDNKYGHPHKATLEKLKQFGISFFRTDEGGNIKIKSDGENVAVVE